MREYLRRWLAAAAMSVAMAAAAFQPGQSVGLVLSGGGAKGIAHIGVIKALEDNNIPIDFVAGTSMGAIIGGLYACGYTPEEMMELLLSDGFAMWSTGQIDPNLTYYFLQQPQTPAFAQMNVNTGRRDSTATSQGLMPTSLISPLPMNFAFMDLFSAYTAQCGGNFNNLFVPFRCVASDVVHKHKVVCRSGMLSDAIRASMTFPAVFEPISIDGVELYDGGIYDNFPVDVMREDFSPSIMIGVDVHSENAEPSNSIVSQLENMIIQNNSYELPPHEGIRIHVDVSRFSLLDFAKAREIYTIGYNRAMEMMDSVCSRVTSRIPAHTRRLKRDMFKSATPYVRFDSVHVTGGTPAQNEYLTQLFARTKHHADTFGIEQAQRAYYRALTPGKLRNLFPQAHYNPATGLFSLDLTADVKDNLSLGAGGYLTSSVNSMIFVSASYSSMSFSSFTSRLMGWIGQSYMAAQADVQMNMTNTIPSALKLKAVVARQKYYETDRLFFEDNSPAFISNYDMFGRLSYTWAVGRRGKAGVEVGGGQSRNKFYSGEQLMANTPAGEYTKMNLGQAVGRFEINSLDNQSYPSAGSRIEVTAMQTFGRYHHQFHAHAADNTEFPTYSHNIHWFQAELTAENYFQLGKNFALGASCDVLVSNRRMLNTYLSTVVNAPSFSPFASLDNVFNKAFHANAFAAAGITPIWRPLQRAQVRLAAYTFMPFRRIEPTADGSAEHGRWFRDPEFLAELDLVYNLPFASISGYVNYLSSPSGSWNVGLAFGLYFTASKFLR